MNARDDVRAEVEHAIRIFVGEFVRLRTERNKSQKALARATGFSPSYISHLESGRLTPSRKFAMQADRALEAHAVLEQLWQEYFTRVNPELPDALPADDAEPRLGQAYENVPDLERSDRHDSADAPRSASVQMDAHAGDNSRIYQAAGDVNITER